ncbi:hypothetical protein QJQ45_026853 [Haematococcus lacustris]|nr:hypothetical protein QJQ45_026853 [Haematococcus lacustris]
MVPRPAAAAPAEPDTTTSSPNDTKKKSKKQQRSKEDKAKAARLDKGPGVHIKKVIDKKLKGKLRHAEAVFREAHEKAVKANEWLLPAEAGFLEAEAAERTWNAQQRDLAGAVELGAARKLFELRLPDLGPYRLAFTRNGRHCALAGALGHLAVMDWQRQQLVCEVQVREATHDICFLHNETFFAAAQKKCVGSGAAGCGLRVGGVKMSGQAWQEGAGLVGKIEGACLQTGITTIIHISIVSISVFSIVSRYVYIYDKRGVEVHCLREHQGARILQFLPHHFLLASIGDLGVLRYQDTSTGVVAAQHRTRLGPCSALRLNPWNAVLGAGHSGGVVTMWTPNLPTPVVRMLCHRGRVNALAFDPAGRYMVTAGADSQVKVWDVRTYQPLHAYFAYSPATVLDISQRGLLAVGYGRKVQIWKDALSSKANAPYMSHSLYEGDQLSDAQFVGYEDVMGLGSSGGMSTILVPGKILTTVPPPLHTARQMALCPPPCPPPLPPSSPMPSPTHSSPLSFPPPPDRYPTVTPGPRSYPGHPPPLNPRPLHWPPRPPSPPPPLPLHKKPDTQSMPRESGMHCRRGIRVAREEQQSAPDPLTPSGAGEPNFDSMVANPYASLRERREGEVAALLDKLQPDTIVLDPDSIARVRKEPAEVLKEKRLEAAAATKERRAAAEEKNEAKVSGVEAAGSRVAAGRRLPATLLSGTVAQSKMKGKNRPSKRHRKKQTNIIEERKPVVKQRMKEQVRVSYVVRSGGMWSSSGRRRCKKLYNTRLPLQLLPLQMSPGLCNACTPRLEHQTPSPALHYPEVVVAAYSPMRARS